MYRSSLLSAIVTPAILLGSLVTAFPAFASGEADDQSAGASAPGDIVVTANRREEKLQRVPVSIAAATGEMLGALNIRRPEDLTRLIPGFTAIPNAGSAVTSYNIRGVGQSDFAEHEEQPVTAYQDGVYIANAAATGFPLFDVARVELLRGPQGTLFGRNATGGLVQFFSNQPKAGMSGFATLTAGDFNLHRAEGALNYGTDRLAIRVAGYYSDNDGYIKNTMGKNLFGEEVGAVRVQIAYNPSPSTSLTLRLEGFNSDGTSGERPYPSYYPAGAAFPSLLPANVDAYGTGAGKDFFGYRGPSDPYVQAVNDPGSIYKRSRTIALTARHDLGELSLYSITSYNNAKEAYTEDSDGSPSLSQSYADSTRSHTFSQELRLQKSTGQFRFTVGGYFFDVDGHYNIANTLNFCDATNTTTCSFATNLPLNPDVTRGATAASAYSLNTRSEAVFGQAEYDLTDKLTFVLGGRYTWDQQKFDYAFTCTETLNSACNATFGVGNHPGVVALTGPLRLRQNHGNWSGKATLNYKIDPNIIAYMSINRGIKSSGYIFSFDGQLTPEELSFKPEQLTSYEPGIKATLFGRKLTANLSLFHYDYHNFQAFQFSGVSASVVNRDAYANGGELEFASRPGWGIDATLGIAYDDFWVKDITISPGVVAKQRPINAPKWQVNWGLSKAFTLPDGLTLRLGYHGRYTGDRFFNAVNEEVVRGPAVTQHDADISIETGSGLTLRAYVNNFTNATMMTVAFDETVEGYVLQHFAPPRTFGASVGYKF